MGYTTSMIPQKKYHENTAEGSEEANRPSSFYHAVCMWGGKNHEAVHPGRRWRCGETYMQVHARGELCCVGLAAVAPHTQLSPARGRHAQCTPGKELTLPLYDLVKSKQILFHQPEAQTNWVLELSEQLFLAQGRFVLPIFSHRCRASPRSFSAESLT